MHLEIIGRSRYGNSTFLEHQILNAPGGFVFLDLHGHSAERIADTIACIYWDASGTGIGFNPLGHVPQGQHLLACVDGDLACWPGQRFAHDLDAGLLVVVLGANPLEVFGGAQQGDAATRNDAFLNRRTSRMHRVINAILALLYFSFGRATDTDHRDAACELGQLMSKHRVLSLKPQLRLEWRGQDGQNERW
jgi:hypothetical protein